MLQSAERRCVFNLYSHHGLMFLVTDKVIMFILHKIWFMLELLAIVDDELQLCTTKYVCVKTVPVILYVFSLYTS